MLRGNRASAGPFGLWIRLTTVILWEILIGSFWVFDVDWKWRQDGVFRALDTANFHSFMRNSN